MHHLLVALAIAGMFSGLLMVPAIFVAPQRACKDEAEADDLSGFSRCECRSGSALPASPQESIPRQATRPPARWVSGRQLKIVLRSPNR